MSIPGPPQPRRETTEWDDILVKHGVKEADPNVVKRMTAEEYDSAAAEAREMAEKLREKREDNSDDDVDDRSDVSLDGLEELEDILDDGILEAYREKRLQEMRKAAAGDKFGSLVTISEPDWIAEVTKADSSVWVVVLLHESGVPHCDVVEARLKELAQRHRATKFVKIRSQEAIHNYPMKNVPTVFVYKAGQLAAQMVGMRQIGRPDVTADELEWGLSKTGAVKTELEYDPYEDREDKSTLHRL